MIYGTEALTYIAEALQLAGIDVSADELTLSIRIKGSADAADVLTALGTIHGALPRLEDQIATAFMSSQNRSVAEAPSAREKAAGACQALASLGSLVGSVAARQLAGDVDASYLAHALAESIAARCGNEEFLELLGWEIAARANDTITEADIDLQRFADHLVAHDVDARVDPDSGQMYVVVHSSDGWGGIYAFDGLDTIVRQTAEYAETPDFVRRVEEAHPKFPEDEAERQKLREKAKTSEAMVAEVMRRIVELYEEW